MIKLKNFAGVLLIVALPSAASAQFGGLVKTAKGALGGGSTVSTGDAEGFLDGAAQSTKNVMIAAALLAQAITDRNGLAGKKAEIDAIQGIQDVKEFGAHKASLQSNLDVLSQRENLSGDLQVAYETGNAKQKKIISTAVLNLAIGVGRNVLLAGQAPTMLKGIGRNPALATRAGQFKTAGELITLQARGLGGIATHLPTLMKAMKVQAPSDLNTTEPQPVVF